MDLDRFNKLLENQKNIEDNSPSFLEVIGRYYDENIISRYLLYIFTHNIDLLNQILRSCYQDSFTNIDSISFSTNEYVISESRRIDILIEGIDIDASKVLIVIENKINSSEHSNQCREYFNDCNIIYKEYKQYYLFLYPDYNLFIKELSDSHFKKITYSKLLELIDSLENKTIYENDFIKLISNQLRSRPMDELKTFLVNHYYQIQGNMNSIDKDIDNIFNEFKDQFIKLNKGFLAEYADSHRTLRFYKEDPKWWNGWKVSNEERIYFYIELKCEGNLDFYLQRTLKVYSKNPNTRINRYILDIISSGTKLVSKRYMDTFKIFERIKIDSSYQVLSNNWKQDLFSQVEEGLEKLSIHQQEEVERYSRYLESID